MGQVLPVFAHCKEAPSTASSTPDSTEGGNDDSDFRELHTAREFSEDDEEETTSQGWGTPRELTFSYIAFEGVLGWAARGAGSSPDSSTSSSTPLEDEEQDRSEAGEAEDELGLQLRLTQPSPPEGWAPQPSPSSGTSRAHTPSPAPSRDSNSWRDEPSLDPKEEEPWGPLEREPITGQCLDSTDQSEFAFKPHLLVADLLYWKDARWSGAVFTGLMVSLLCLLHFSIVSVAAHVALLLLCGTISLRVYRKMLQAVSRGDGANPFQAYLDVDLTLTLEQTECLSQQIASRVVSGARHLRHFFLVEDFVDSLKLALLFYILTYVGAVFNGLTLLILGVIALFTLPLLYRQHQVQIDQYVGLVTNQLSHIKAKIRAKIPGTGALASAAAAVSGSKAKAE
ncbi:reticulon-2 [Echinops telfairi]|uniref:Reticulon-2 n=1 Tax=Echinops telfairi TaxID=9371 RepID=A0AC55DA40_ECHTE|nr:reticulon-2 [Echinops telfairi]